MISSDKFKPKNPSAEVLSSILHQDLEYLTKAKPLWHIILLASVHLRYYPTSDSPSKNI